MFYLLALAISGLLVGALGRLVIPGPNPMSIPMTMLVGVGGSVIGGAVGYALFRSSGGLVLAVAGSALIVWLMERNRAGRPTT